MGHQTSVSLLEIHKFSVQKIHGNGMEWVDTLDVRLTWEVSMHPASCSYSNEDYIRCFTCGMVKKTCFTMLTFISFIIENQ